ncbi:MAG TPA: ABC transporter permease [Chthoniobacteraceae bacterium]|nr:ABC transporter permease [Chthoniobacteraceae bacterium]
MDKPGEAPIAQEIVIEAGKTELHYWRDLWRYRELFYFLAWRDILVRYKQTSIGIAWAVLQPLSMTFVGVFIFQYIAKLHSIPNVPYAVMVLTAQLPWQFFSRALSEASNSLIVNTNLISKIYFPRLIIPAASVITALIDFAISAVLLAVMMACYRFMPDWRIVAAPFFLLLAIGGAVGAGLWFAALNVSYRDFRYIVPFIVTIGASVSPVAFPTDAVPGRFRFLYSLNPMVGVIDGFRWSLLKGNAEIYPPALVVSVVVIGAVLVTGILYFRKTEKRFADVI